ncbi:MAG: prepilin-type N-terminal cleavage/methylation domain-containing protein [SAR324 cluster bacterium]|nr:prepilin-type N-terminal cleavage/methylation domain-containing protein [SAR324 cluster bacterium]
MPTFPRKTCNRPRARGGFTLIELMLVLVLLSLTLFLAVPAFQNLTQGSLQREVRRLTGVVRLIRNEAILTRRPFRLMFDLKARRYYVEELSREGKFVLREQPKELAAHTFPPSFVLRDIVVFGDKIGQQRDRAVAVRVDISGLVDPFLLHFSEDGEEWTLKVLGLTGKMELEKGYVEPRAPTR